MKFVSLSSGSRGNSALICTGSTRILVDCGLSAKKTGEMLRTLGLSLDSIDALLITHEHSDHIKGAKRLMQAYGIPVYATGGTLRALPQAAGDDYFKYAGKSLMEEIYPDRAFAIGDIGILPFRTYHDVAEPCAYRFEVFQEGVSDDGRELRKHVETAIMTDCGHCDDYIADHMKLLDAMLLESNHDIDMLDNGPYPMFLKRRIRSDHGHLSNDASSELLSQIISAKLKTVLLGHLSHENNTRELALSTARNRLMAVCGRVTAESMDINVAPEGTLSKLVEL